MSADLKTEQASITELVGAGKASVLNSGAVKDDKTQALSSLQEKECALGIREGTRPKASHKAGRQKKSDSRQGMGAKSADPAEGEKPRADAKIRVRDAVASYAASELDDTDEFEGTRGAYDAAEGTRRAHSKMRAKRAKDSAKKTQGAVATKDGGKAKSALGAKKQAASGAGAKSAEGAAAKAAAQPVQAATGRAAAGGATKAVAGAVGTPVGAVVGGIVCGIIAFLLGAMVVGQAISAIFGFWENEEAKRSLEGLPPYITYEMVEEALLCQEEYGHPAGCTIAQIICESGQGDSMSMLATRDHNLFGMKWASSFASAPEVKGKASWSTGEEYDGAHVTIQAQFTVFKGDRECIRFRSRVFLQSRTYSQNALIQEAMRTHDSDKMAEGLKAAGWATSSSYVESLKSIMDTYSLRHFDSMSAEDFKNGTPNGDVIVAAAMSQLGVPYVWGGSTPGVGLDCSGLTQYCYRQAGISIPHNSEAQRRAGQAIPLSEARPGDILYKTGHVAIYTGGDTYIHEPHSGAVCTQARGISYFTCALRFR